MNSGAMSCMNPGSKATILWKSSSSVSLLHAASLGQEHRWDHESCISDKRKWQTYAEINLLNSEIAEIVAVAVLQQQRRDIAIALPEAIASGNKILDLAV